MLPNISIASVVGWGWGGGRIRNQCSKWMENCITNIICLWAENTLGGVLSWLETLCHMSSLICRYKYIFPSQKYVNFISNHEIEKLHVKTRDKFKENTKIHSL